MSEEEMYLWIADIVRDSRNPYKFVVMGSTYLEAHDKLMTELGIRGDKDNITSVQLRRNKFNCVQMKL